jgi:hypothetical protein
VHPRLPPRCSLEHLRKDAKAVLRVVAQYNDRWRLADAQHAVARGYGFPSWPELKAHVEALAPAYSDARIERRQSEDAKGAHSRDAHPIQGTWTERRTLQFLSVAAAGDLLTMTHVTLGTGREAAVRVAIRTDGREHSIDAGGTEVLQACWIGPRVLEMIAKRGGQTVARGEYALSEDGSTLTVSTTADVVVFERAQSMRAKEVR